MSDIRKLINIISETTAGATASGSVASAAQPMETLRRRNDEDYAAESADSTPEMPQVLEYGNWENSALTTSKKLKKARSKAKKIVKSIYGEDKPEVDETLHGKQKKLDMNKSGSLDSEDFALLRSKKKVSESRKLASNLAEGRLKQALWDDAEELSLDDFLEKHSKHDSDTEWLTVFWKKTNGVEDDKQDVAEGIVDTINRGVKSVKRVLDRNQLELPTKPETVKIGNFEVELTPMLDQGYIEALWQDSEGRKRRVEISTTYHEWDDERGELENKKTRKELYSDIKEEILFVEKQLEKNKEQGVAEGSELKTFRVMYYNPTTDRNHTRDIKSNNESDVWDKFKSKGLDIISITELGLVDKDGDDRGFQYRDIDDQGVAEGSNVDSQIKRIKDRILQLKDWNTTGTHDKKIKELQARLKELQAQKQSVTEGSGQEGLQQDKKLLQDIIDFAKQNGYKVTYRSPQKSWEEVRPGPGVSILYFENNNTELAFYAEVVKKSTRIYIRFGSIDGSFLDDIVFTPKEFLTAFKHAHQKLLDPANRDDRDHPLRSFLDLRLGTIDGRPVRDVIAPKPARIKASNKQGVAEGKKKIHYKVDILDKWGNIRNDFFIAQNDEDAKEIARQKKGRNLQRQVGYDNFIKIPMNAKEEPLSPWYAGVGGIPGSYRIKEEQDVAEDFFGIDDKIKGKIKNIVSRLSDEYGMWDHKAQTFTPDGFEHLKSILKFNDKYIKYALSLTSRDFEAEGVAEGSSFDRWANARAASQLHKLRRDHSKDKKTRSDKVQQYEDDWKQRQDDWEQRQIEKMKKYRNSEQDVTEGDDGDDTPATERVFKYNKTNPERLIARMEKEIKQAEAEGWTIVAKRESPKTGNIVVKMIRKQGVAEGSEYTPPKLGTVKANIMNSTKPTVQVQVFKHNTLRGDSYWVTKEVKTFKTMDQANAYVDRINKQGVAEDITRRGFLRGLGAAGIATAGIGSATSAQARSTEEFRQTYKAARELLQQNPKLTSAEIAKQLQITEPEPRQKLPVTMLGRWGAIYLAMQDMNLPIR